MDFKEVKRRVGVSNEYFNTAQEKTEGLFRHLTTILLAFLALLLGLKPLQSGHPRADIVFLLCLSLIVLSILFSIASLYVGTQLSWQIHLDYRKQIQEYIHSEERKSILYNETKKLNIDRFFQISALVSLALSLIMLLFYVGYNLNL